MKTLLLVLAALGVSGCAVYPAAPYETYGTGAPYVAPYVVTPPVYIQGGILYQHDVYPNFYPRGYYRGQPGFNPYHSRRPGMRDRDGDGVPNRFDRRPHDPRRR